MNRDLDIASDLSERAVATPFPPSQRRIVFIPRTGFLFQDRDLETQWRRWGGETEFIYDEKRAGECGLCIFTRGALGTNNRLAELVKPFFDRHGLEANVFEYDDRALTFRRINPAWLATYYPTPA